MKNLAPEIYRQRLTIEWIYKELPSKEDWKKYLSKLSELLEMQIIYWPFVHNWAEESNPNEFGAREWFAIRTTSWVHMYTREKKWKLLTVDIYTCKKFEPVLAVEFTKDFFELIKVEFDSRWYKWV
jgi:S-adenosylmethionine decarboxylase